MERFGPALRETRLHRVRSAAEAKAQIEHPVYGSVQPPTVADEHRSIAPLHLKVKVGFG